MAKELEDLRNSYEAQIHALSIQRNSLLEETANLARFRDQTIQDTEQLNVKNAQLMDLNNEITRQIQGRFETHKGSLPAPNGLGILNKDGSELEYRHRGDHHHHPPGSSHAIQEGDDDDVVIAQPTIINVGRKGGYAKKSWMKKGGAAIIKGAGKGFKTVFSGENQQVQGHHYESNTSLLPPQTDSPYLPRSATAPDPHGGFDRLFGTRRLGKKGERTANGGYATVIGEKPGSFSSSGIFPPMKEDGSVPLFGSELEVRAAYEGKSIPYVVSRCIQEVEARGMCDLLSIWGVLVGVNRWVQGWILKASTANLEEPPQCVRYRRRLRRERSWILEIRLISVESPVC